MVHKISLSFWGVFPEHLDAPVEIWMKPNRMMVIRASSLEAVNRSWTLVAAFTLMQLTNVREAAGDINRWNIEFQCCLRCRLRREGLTGSTH